MTCEHVAFTVGFNEHTGFPMVPICNGVRNRCRVCPLIAVCLQFTELGRHKHIEGMEHITAGFDTILEEIRRKPYDLLDATRCNAEFSMGAADIRMPPVVPAMRDLHRTPTAVSAVQGSV